MVKARDWLRLMRAQTAPATVFTLLIPYFTAGGRDITVAILLFILGHLTHFFSFGHNSLMDYHHDVNDPSKRHHPLVSGAIKIEDANKVIHYGLALTALFFAAFIFLKSESKTLAFASLLLYTVFGHAYNDGLDHSTAHSWITISMCFTSLVGVGWFTATHNISQTLLLIYVWAFLTIFYQIGYEGNLKDLWNPSEKHNLLRKFSNIGGNTLLELKTGVNIFFFLVRGVANTLVLVALTNNIYSCVALLATSIFEFLALYNLHFRKPISRDKLLSSMGLAEAVEFFRLIGAVIEPILGLTLIAYGLTYFICMNHILWATKMGPRV
ncbi:MAG: UbiA family prenyltransferase [Thermoproteota archaeon]